VWRFVHGPGLDDPLVALKRDIGTQNYAKYYYLTDAQGREYAFTDAQGYDVTQDVAYWQNGGNQSGAVARASGFDNQRATSGTAPDVSFYRNRYYDQKTGRWTQEDPIGIAGGVNLYQYAGNNPATFSDPFGLRVCFRGAGQRYLADATGRAVGASLVLDQAGCVDSIIPWGADSKYGVLRSRLMELIADPETYTVALTGKSGSYQEAHWIGVALSDLGGLYPQSSANQTCALGPAGFTKASIITHELLGHAYGLYHHWLYRTLLGRLVGQSGEQYAIKAENMYHNAAGEPARCAY